MGRRRSLWVKLCNALKEHMFSAFAGSRHVDGHARRLGSATAACFKPPKREAGIMCYELSDGEWATIRPMLPNKARGVPRVDDRGVLNGIFWVLRSGAPWRDLMLDRPTRGRHRANQRGLTSFRTIGAQNRSPEHHQLDTFPELSRGRKRARETRNGVGSETRLRPTQLCLCGGPRRGEGPARH